MTDTDRPITMEDLRAGLANLRRPNHQTFRCEGCGESSLPGETPYIFNRKILHRDCFFKALEGNSDEG